MVIFAGFFARRGVFTQSLQLGHALVPEAPASCGRLEKPRHPVFHPWTKQSFADIGMTKRELGHEGKKNCEFRDLQHP